MKRTALFLLLLFATTAEAATNVSGNIATNTTWTVAGSPYILTGDVSVGGSASPVLTIEPGVTIKGNANAHLLINFYDKGAMVANGTAEAPVVFTANGSTATGFWQGFHFGTIAGGPASSLSYATVEYAGSNQNAIGGITIRAFSPAFDHVTLRANQYAGIKIENGTPSITASTIRDNAGHGIYVTGGDPTLTDVALIANSGTAVSVPVMTQLAGMTGLSATGNGTNAVEYRAGDMTVSRTWRTCAIPYLVTGSIHVKAASAPILTIEAGNTIRFNGSSQIAVNYQNKGGLAANGTASAPILFTSHAATPAPGSWWGLYFGDVTGNTPSTITHATIEYGGYAAAQRGGVTVYNASPAFDHVTIRNSAYAGAAMHGGAASFLSSTISNNSGAGIHVVNPVTLTLTDTAFTNNNGYAVSAHVGTTLTSVSGLSASGNGTGRDAIEIRAGDMTTSRTWRSSALPYVVAGSIHVKGSTAPILTIEAGNTVRFANNAQIAVNYLDRGGLAANGTPTAPILFTSNAATPTPGIWWGLYFGDVAGNTPSTVTHAIIEYGGLAAGQRGGVTIHNVWPVFSNVTIRNSAFAGAALHGAGASFSDCTLTANGGPGIHAVNPATLTLTNTAFTNNSGYAVTAAAASTFNGMSGLSASGNGTGRDGIEIRQGVITSDRTWPASPIPWIITGNLDVQAASSPILTILAGNTVRFNNNAQIAVNHSNKGGLRANGTEAAPILFTSNGTATQGQWLGLWFGPTAGPPQSNLTWTTVEYGGSTYWSRGGVTTNTGAPVFDHLTVRNNQYAGMVMNGGAPVLRDSTITANGGPGLRATAGTSLTLANDTFTGNNGYAVTLPVSVAVIDGSGLAASGNGANRDAIEYRQGVISANTTWPNAGLPYAISGFVDVEGSAAPILTIAAGTSIRFNAGAQLTANHNNRGGLQAIGTASAPITFTANGTLTPGFWLGLWFGPTSNPPPSSISFAVVEYGGISASSRGGITVNAGAPVFDHLTLRNNQFSGLSAAGSSSPRITNTHFHSNPNGIRTSGTAVVQGKLNYWNAAEGPCTLGSCASGQQSVSSAVKYEPWLTSAPTEPQFLTDSIQKNRIFSPAIGAQTILDYATALSGDVTVTIRNAADTVVRTLNGSGTTGTVSWNGKNDANVLQPDGTYTFEIASTAPSQPPAAVARGLAIVDSTRTLTLSNPASSLAYFSPNGDSVQDTVTVTAATNYDDAAWTVSVLDAASNVVRAQNGTGPAVSYSWNGRNESNVVQPDGLYTLRVEAAEGSAAVQGNAGTTLDNTPPAASIATPAASTVLSNVYSNGVTNYNVTGSVSDAHLLHWVLDLGAGAAPSSWSAIGSGDYPVSSGYLGTWQSWFSANGPYAFRVFANDRAGNVTFTAATPVTLGHFKVAQSAFQFNVATGGTVTYTSTVPFPLTETIVVKNEAGTVVRNLVAASARAAGSFNDSFNGRNDANALLPDGPYFYVATVTDGTSTFTWDLSSDFRFDYSSFNDNLNIQAFDPFNNKPMKFNYNFTQPARVNIAMTTTPGSVVGDCLNPTATFFCAVINRWEESGPKTFTWSGIDHTGAYRVTRSVGIVTVTDKWAKNAALMYGVRPKVENVKVTPPVFGPAVGAQAIELDLTTYQSQPADLSIALINLSTISTLRTLTVNGQAAGHVTVPWDGRADNGMLVAPGFYRVLVTATDAQGNAVKGDILTTIQY